MVRFIGANQTHFIKCTHPVYEIHSEELILLSMLGTLEKERLNLFAKRI